MWTVDNYRVSRWYYRDAPCVGDRVNYMDGTRTRIAAVGLAHITLDNSMRMRRPYLCARIGTWIFQKVTEYWSTRQATRVQSQTSQTISYLSRVTTAGPGYTFLAN